MIDFLTMYGLRGNTVPTPTIVCLLGMHRSGTSLAARVLNLLGVYLGPEQHLIEPSSDNPTGFWEHQRIVALNERMLLRLGGSWHRPPAFSPGWECTSEWEGFRRQARTIIDDDFAAAALWGWKDPRTCLTLPFWQRLLPPMRYVICLRHPVSVARSLERRNGFSLERGIYLWLAYFNAAMAHTHGQPRIFFFYEPFLSNWRQELPRLADFVRQQGQAERADIQDAVRDFTDADLLHHRTSPGESVYQACLDLPGWVLRVVEQLYESPSGEESLQPYTIDQALAEMAGLIALEVEKEISEEEQARKRWVEQLQHTTGEITALIPPGDALILVDEHQWEINQDLAGRRWIPFLERDGQYWGLPPDDETAIRELERLRHAGARFMVFGWPAFWWLEHYQGLRDYLHSRFSCLLENERLVVFDLQAAGGSRCVS